MIRGVLRRSPALPWLGLAFGVWVAGVARAHLGSEPRGPPAPPWQRSYLELDDAQQRFFRVLREGVLEAENRRAETERWPSPEALAEDGVEPFARGPLVPEVRWSLVKEGRVLNYVGVTERLDWLVLILEPEPWDRSAPPPDDEEHHTIPDGTALHVTVWTRGKGGGVVDGVVEAFPAARGWTQRVGTATLEAVP